MISIDPEIYSELKKRLAQHQAARARAMAAGKALPPTRPQGAKRMWLPDEDEVGSSDEKVAARR